MNAARPEPLRTVRQALESAAAELARNHVPDARYDAEQLLAHVLGEGALSLRVEPERALGEDEALGLDELVRRRARREPLQHLLGVQPFRTLSLAVTPAVLIPRPETEELVDRALALLADMGAAPQVLDLGTGSGCIALAITAEHPGSRVTGVEISDTALRVAKANADRHNLSGRVQLLCGDMYAPLPPAERFDLIVSNPPYLTAQEWRDAEPEVRDFEPRWALVGGEDGLAAFRRIFADAPAHLRDNGAVLVEIGWMQGAAVSAIAWQTGFTEVSVFPDLAGRDRMVLARKYVGARKEAV